MDNDVSIAVFSLYPLYVFLTHEGTIFIKNKVKPDNRFFFLFKFGIIEKEKRDLYAHG